MQEDFNRLRIDDSQLATISAAMLRSLCSREMIRIKMYDPQEELLIEGVIDFFDPVVGKFEVDGEWFDVSNIVTMA